MDLSIKIYDPSGKGGSTAKLSPEVFNRPPKEHLLYETVTAYLGRKRQGSANTKNWADVRGGGAKPFRQKGTGNARQGSSRSPLMPGGATLFGPTPRSYGFKLPKKARREALRVALSQRCSEGKIFGLEDAKMDAPKTKTMKAFMEKLSLQKALFIGDGNENLEKSVRNLKGAKYSDATHLNVFDILKFENLIFSTAALKKVEEAVKA